METINSSGQSAPGEPGKFRSIKGRLTSGRSPEDLKILGDLVDRHYRCVFMDVAELTGLTDAILVEEIVIRVFIQLFKSGYDETQGIPPGRFLYKILVHQVFSYLEEMNNRERILIVQDILTVELLWCHDLIFPDTKPRSRINTLLSNLKKIFNVPF